MTELKSPKVFWWLLMLLKSEWTEMWSFDVINDQMWRVVWRPAPYRSPLRVDYERIKAVGPDRAAAEWLLRCGAKVRFQGFDRWHHDYNALPTGPLGRYKIQAIDATESCIMYRGFDHLGQCPSHVPHIRSWIFSFKPVFSLHPSVRMKTEQKYLLDWGS